MGLPRQKISIHLKGKDWGKDTIDHFEILTGGATDVIRSSNNAKKVNYDLFNGKFNIKDLEYVCNPLGLSTGGEFPATLQHYDKVSPCFNLLIGEETKRPDNCIVISQSTNDINRKQGQLKDSIVKLLQQELMAEIDPSTIDPNNPPQTPEQILKYAKHNVSDLIESQANKILKYVKRALNTKEIFKKGWKDALITGEEIYWTGVSNNEVNFRRCNPLNITVILDGDSDFIDDAIAVTEVRMMSISSIIDEFGDILSKSQIDDLESITRGNGGSGRISNSPTFTLDYTGAVVDTGVSGFSTNWGTSGSYNQDILRVLRVEWKSFKKLYHLAYTDDDGILQETIVDETFKINEFRQAYPDALAEEFWINEAWEGIKIHDDIHIGIQPKTNQRRKMDNPYYCKLGYVGHIYNATNSTSVSLMDRLKPYQYLYNIISYRLELAFASDQGKIMLMDVAQLPRSEGIDMDRWLYYLKAMKIGFINSHEEGNKGSAIGKFPQFNQFQAIDLSLANQIQQYISTLDYISQQIAYVSGVSPQRLGAIENRELVGNVERAVTQSALITEYLFDSHDEVKRRVYTALVECAKIAFREGKIVQYVLDDMGIELLNIAEFELENSEFNVFMSNSNKDTQVVETLKMLAQEALKTDKVDLSAIIDTVINNNPADIKATIKRGEEAKYARDKATQDQQLQHEEKLHQEALADKQADRDLKQYEVDQNNATKIAVAEMQAYMGQESLDQDNDGVPDPIEIGRLALDQQDVAQKAFLENTKLAYDKEKHQKEIDNKNKEVELKREIETKKIDAIKVQNQSQEKMQQAQFENDKKTRAMESDVENKRLAAEKEMHAKEMKIKEKELELKKADNKTKLEIEKIKLQAAKSKAANDEKKQKLMLRKAAQPPKKPKK